MTLRIEQLACLWLLAVFVMLVSAHAATITVTSIADSGSGSLRAAVSSATNGNVINFALTTPATITLTSGELLLEKSISIIGPGTVALAINGNAASRVFDIRGGVTVLIANLTITNGNFTNGTGGGILNTRSTLTVSNCIVSGNSASSGGGIFNDYGSGSASLSVAASAFNGNSADQGGALYNNAVNTGSAVVGITASTFSSNSAHYGGAIYNNGSVSGAAALTIGASSLRGNVARADDGGGGGLGGAIYNDGHSSGSATVTLYMNTLTGNSATNRGGAIYSDGNGGRAPCYIGTCTFSSNQAGFFGGGIYTVGFQSSSFIAVNASTFSGNSALSGGSITVDNAQLDIGDSILNAGASGGNISHFAGGVSSQGFNLSSDGAGGFLITATDQINTDPVLGPLADNGGPTLTHALLPGSPAINRGKRDVIPFLVFDTDQRGVPRTIGNVFVAGGDGSDVGAYELILPLQITVLVPLGNGRLELECQGLPNRSYTIQASTNLISTNWGNIGTIQANGTGYFSLVDSNTPAFPARFYRVLSPSGP